MPLDNSTNNNNNSTNKPPSPTPTDMQRNRRGSITSAAFTQMFQRSNSTAGTPVFPGAITTAAINERRRLSVVSTSTLGISGTSPTSATGLGRRASTSTSSDLDEFAIDEEDSPSASRTAPVTPFNRRVSFGTAAGMRRPGGTSPGTGNGRPTAQIPNDGVSPHVQHRGTDTVPPTPPDSAAPTSGTASVISWKSIAYSTTQAQPTDTGNVATVTTAPRTRPRAASDLFSASRPDQGFNWSEQLRSRAESTVASGSRPSFSFASGLTGSPPRPGAVPPSGAHDRTRSVSEMPAPPAQAPKPRSPPRDTRPKPDHFQERILKGDFYMD